MVESSIVRYKNIEEQVEPLFVPLTKRYLHIQELGHEVYLTQLKQGFYPDPDNLSPQEREELENNPKLQSSYQPKIRKDGQLAAVDYKDIPPFNKLLPQMADEMEEAINFALKEKLPQAYFIEANLKPQAQALRDGNFERAMLTRLNTVYSPKYELFFGLLDRYLDTLLNRHYSFQGWVFEQDSLSTEAFNKRVQDGQERTSLFLSRPLVRSARRMIVGNVLAFSGLATEREWMGNTLPSEDHLRHTIGSLSYLNLNVIKKKVDLYFKPVVETLVPELTQLSRWEEKVEIGYANSIVLHEGVGHALAIFDETSEDILKENYTTLKELEAELLSFIAAIRLRQDLGDNNLKKAIIGSSLAGWISDIERFKAEEDPNKKKTALTYARTGELLLNCLESAQGIRVNADNGRISIPADLQQVLAASRNILIVLENAIATEKLQPGAVDRFIDLYSRYPRSYLVFS